MKPSTGTATGTGTGTGQAAWSAALRFAPAAASRRKPAAVKPVVGSLVAARVATTSTTFSAAPAVVVPAPPTTTTEPIDVDQPTGTDASGKKIFRPPAMTLDQNEAFSHAMGGRKRPAGGQGGPNKKKKWKKVGLPFGRRREKAKSSRRTRNNSKSRSTCSSRTNRTTLQNQTTCKSTANTGNRGARNGNGRSGSRENGGGVRRVGLARMKRTSTVKKRRRGGMVGPALGIPHSLRLTHSFVR